MNATRSNAPFSYCLNTSTIRGQKVPLDQAVDIAADAGYNAIEPWIDEMDALTAGGGSTRDLRNRIEDQGLKVASVIGFFEWIVDDAGRRARAMEEARRSMDLAAQIASPLIAAPAFGAAEQGGIDPRRAAERYRAVLELGDRMGVVPQAEVWGFSQTLRTLGETVRLAIDSDHPSACVLADVYHLYKGGSGFEGLRLLNKNALRMLHMNDYPAQPPMDTITDADRVYPGDGIAPLTTIVRDLQDIGFDGPLSLELFNESYWKQDARAVARTGLAKMRAAVAAAVESR